MHGARSHLVVRIAVIPVIAVVVLARSGGGLRRAHPGEDFTATFSIRVE